MQRKPRISSVKTGLRWTQPGLTRQFELRADDDALATLGFVSMFGSLANGESTEGRWTFERTGFINTRVTVRDSRTQADLAVFHNNTWHGGGTLEFPDGRRYTASSNFWHTRYDIRARDEAPIVTFERIRGQVHLGSEVIVHPRAQAMRELPWLIMLGWYVTVMKHGDAAMTM